LSLLEFVNFYLEQNQNNSQKDKKTKDLYVINDKDLYILSSFLQKEDITNIWNRNEMSLLIGRKLVDTISLKGSAKAFQALNRCYEMLPQ